MEKLTTEELECALTHVEDTRDYYVNMLNDEELLGMPSSLRKHIHAQWHLMLGIAYKFRTELEKR